MTLTHHSNEPFALPRRPAGVSALSRRQTPSRAPERRAVGLGWVGIGLGLAELLAPRQVAQLLGIDDDESTCLALRGLGARELVSGLGLLSEKQPAAWTWARVAGDVMDLALLGYAWTAQPPSPERALSVGASLLGVVALDVQTAYALSNERSPRVARGVRVRQGISIQRSPDEVYAFFRKLENLPTFMYHLQSVTESNGRTRWCANGPLGTAIEWEAEITQDQPGRRLAWRSLEGADVPNQGRVEFRPTADGNGTELVVDLRYDPPAGAIGKAFAQLFGREPAQEISADLRRLRQVLETGEVLHSDASIHRGMHPARPSSLSAQASEGKVLR